MQTLWTLLTITVNPRETGIVETVGEICSGIMSLWAIIGFVSTLSHNPKLEAFMQETYVFIPIVVVIWFLFAGDVTDIWDLIRLAVWGWIWYDAYSNRDGRWKRRKRRISEKVQVLASGKLAVVASK